MKKKLLPLSLNVDKIYELLWAGYVAQMVKQKLDTEFLARKASI
jgi:hypothetical protein